MRVLTVIPVMGAGGAEVVAASVVRDLVDRGHDVLLASAGGFRADALTADGLAHLDLPTDGRGPADLARAVRRLRRTVRRLRPDVVHAHNVKAAVLARLAVGRGVPVVTTLHGIPDHETRVGVRLLRATSDHVVAVSDHVRDVLLAEGFPPQRTSVVPNAVATPTLVPRERARRELGLPPDAPVVVVLARLAAQKRHDLLLEAWAAAPADAALLCAGDGPTRAALEAQAARVTGGDRVRFLGERTDPERLLGAADLLILPTDWEGLPISLLEALGAGVPALVSDVGGVAALREGIHPVDAGSVDALADGLRALTSAPDAAERRTALAARGRRLVRARFDPGAMHAAYADVLARHAGAPSSSRRGARRAALAGCVALVLALLAGCSTPTGAGTVPPPVVTPATTSGPGESGEPTSDPSDPSDAAPATPTETPTPTPVEPDAALEVVDWGGSRGQLGVVVRNTGTHTITEADVTILGLDAAGGAITVSRSSRTDPCCSIVGLPPGGSYGLFADLDRPLGDLADVRVELDRVETAAPPRDPSAEAVDIRLLDFEQPRGDAVAVAAVRTRGDVGPYLVGQAILENPAGRLVGVISGRFYCYRDGRRARVRMELLRPAPPRTRVRSVLAYSVPAGVPAGVTDPCVTSGGK